MTEPHAGSYRPGLDGIRAIAVVAVMWFHLDRLPGGNLGVDAFFVLSGWLITWRLLDEADRDGSVGLRSFWSARARRIMPASVVVLFTIAVVWPVADIDVPSLRRDVVWAAGWASNWGTITGGGDYWARFGEQTPINHFWSLAIEEQFYVVWPLVVFAVVRFARHHRRVVGLVSATAAVASIVVMNVMFDPNDPTATYMNTFARAHNLLIGAAAATVTTVLVDGHLRGGRTARRLAPAAAVVAILVVAFSSDSSTWLFEWGFPLFAIAAVILVVAAADGLGASLLASAPMRWLGTRSYGLYLWHWPVFLFLSVSRLGGSDTVAGRALVDLGRVAVALLFADLSYRFVEQPLRRGTLLTNRRVLAAAPLSILTVALVAVAVVPSPSNTSEESIVTLPPPAPTASTAATPTTDRREPDPTTGTSEPTTTTATVTTSTETSTPSPSPDQTTSSEPDAGLAPVRVIVTGDSSGVHLAEALIAYAATVPNQLTVGSAAAGGCGLSAGDDGRLHEFTNPAGQRELIDLGACRAQWDSVAERVVDEVIDVVLVHVGPWDAVDIHRTDGSVVSVGDAVGRSLVAEAYERFAGEIRRTGAALVWITPADTHLGWGRTDEPLNDPVRWAALRSIVDSLDVTQIDLPGWLVAEGLEGPDARPDGVHLTPALNERFVAEQVAPALADLGT